MAESGTGARLAGEGGASETATPNGSSDRHKAEKREGAKGRGGGEQPKPPPRQHNKLNGKASFYENTISAPLKDGLSVLRPFAASSAKPSRPSVCVCMCVCA